MEPEIRMGIADAISDGNLSGGFSAAATSGIKEAVAAEDRLNETTVSARSHLFERKYALSQLVTYELFQSEKLPDFFLCGTHLTRRNRIFF